MENRPATVDIKRILEDSLTAEGIEEWLVAANRLLDGPIDHRRKGHRECQAGGAGRSGSGRGVTDWTAERSPEYE
jgi:hypothetical protein